tara:strand:- start:2187 stop:2582 length:396 start_codon:yes stop_codon:yes gene_type:complete
MPTLRKTTLRKLYRESLTTVFCGEGDTIDGHIQKALKEDIHLGGSDPGGWSNDNSKLVVYCENGIPNASDVHDFSCEAREFGFSLDDAVVYNSEKWAKVDSLVNEKLGELGYIEKAHHEPHNSAVVSVYAD